MSQNENEKKETEVMETSQNSDFIMVLRKPVKFDGVSRETIDLTELQELKVDDLIQARRMMNLAGASLDPYPERTHEFACYLASIKTGLPYEFFTSLSAADGMELKRRVADFLY